MSSFKLDSIESGSSGLDAFFERDASVVTPVGAPRRVVQAARRIRVGSLVDLTPFVRIGTDQLIHKSTNDLWALRQEGGSYYIERLFDDGAPLKG